MKPKILFVKFDLDALVAAMSPMSAVERGAYMSMLLYLYQHDGRMVYDLAAVKAVCNCRRNFAKVWSRIEEKFSIKNGILRHKVVTKKVRQIRKTMQVQRKKGLKGSNARWHKHRPGNGTGIANNTNTNQNQILINIGFANQGAREGILALDGRIRAEAEDLCDYITRTFRPKPGELTTLSHVVRFMVASVEADSTLTWLTDAKEWAKVAHQDGKKDRGIPLFVATVKKKTGLWSNPKLLRDK